MLGDDDSVIAEERTRSVRGAASHDTTIVSTRWLHILVLHTRSCANACRGPHPLRPYAEKQTCAVAAHLPITRQQRVHLLPVYL